MKSVTLLKAYTLSIFLVAVETKKAREIFKELESFNLIIKNDKEIYSFFINTEINNEDKMYLIEKNFNNVFCKSTVKFVSIIVKENMLSYFDEIINIYKNLLEEKENKVNIKITSSKKLDDTIIKNIVEKIENITKKKSETTTVVDTSLLAGIIVEVNDTVYDYSIKNQINSIYKKVTKKALSV